MDHDYATPHTEAELKQIDEVMLKIGDLITGMPFEVEYNINVGILQIHSGNLSYLLETVGELLTRIQKNVITNHPGDLRTVMAMIPLMDIQHQIVSLIGAEGMRAIANKYGVKMPEAKKAKKTDLVEARLLEHNPEDDANA